MKPAWLPWAGRLVLLAWLVASLFPLYWAAISSLMPEARLFDSPVMFPDAPMLDNYQGLFAQRGFWIPMRNSLVVAGVTTLVCITVGSCCAYAVARLHFNGKTLLMAGILAVGMFPQISIVPPLYLVLRALHLVNSFPGLVFPYVTFALPLTTWLMVGFFRQLPPDLEEAALLEGASRSVILWRIMLPLAAPGMAAAAILTFLYCWNEFLFALSFTVGPERQTVPVAIALMRGRYQIPWGQILAGTVVATAPVVAMVLVFQRWIVKGLTAGAIKG